MSLFRPGRRALLIEPPARVEHTESGRQGTKVAQERRHGLDGCWVRWDRQIMRRSTWHPALMICDIPEES